MLVVDDDPMVVDLVRQLLEDEACEVDAAADGEEALAAIARHPPDVILLDLLMPRLDGFGVLEQLRAEPGLASHPGDRPDRQELSADERALLAAPRRSRSSRSADWIAAALLRGGAARARGLLPRSMRSIGR